MLQEAGHLKNTNVLIFRNIQCLHLMFVEVVWVLVSSGTQVHPQIILDPDYLPDYLSVSYDYGWTYKLHLETIALKALMIMPSLLLQKPSLNLKSKENSETLKPRLSLWKNGQLDQLMIEGKTIQD